VTLRVCLLCVVRWTLLAGVPRRRRRRRRHQCQETGKRSGKKFKEEGEGDERVVKILCKEIIQSLFALKVDKIWNSRSRGNK